MGIKTPLNETPAVSLGASDVSLLELVNAYGTVINDGMVHDPVMVTRIEDKNGKIIYRHKQEQKQALPYETAFLMTQMLMAGLPSRWELLKHFGDMIFSIQYRFRRKDRNFV